MLIEQRVYTLRPGNLDAFMQAQLDRGFELVRAIMERLIGYFTVSFGPQDQVVHLWRWNGYDEWAERMLGLGQIPKLQPYLGAVRPLMLAQENKFLQPAPIAELTPLWGNGNDWLPHQGPRLVTHAPQAVLVDEWTVDLLPGSLPIYWQAYREHALVAADLAAKHLMACFFTVVGRFHQVLHYRWYADLATRSAHNDALRRDPHWREFLAAIDPRIVASTSKLLVPASIPQMSPLFARAQN